MDVKTSGWDFDEEQDVYTVFAKYLLQGEKTTLQQRNMVVILSPL